MIQLRITTGKNKGQEFSFEQGEVTIGRAAENDIILNDPAISKRHFSISLKGQAFLLRDLGSSYGTKLNGVKIDEEKLRDGDTIDVGPVQFRFLGPKNEMESTRMGKLKPTGARAKVPSKLMKAAPEKSAGPKKLVITVGVLLVLGVAGVLGKLVLGSKVRMIASGDQSGIVIPASADVYNNAYGNNDDDSAHPTGVVFSFNYLHGRATIYYSAMVRSRGQVEVLVNDVKVAVVPNSLGRWGDGYKVVLPRNKLLEGADNKVSFRNRSKSDPWGVKNVKIVEDALPSPNPDKAQERFRIAKHALDTAAVSPENMFKAWVGFKDARDLLELAKPHPRLYDEAMAEADELDQQLTQYYKKCQFQSAKFKQLNNAKGEKSLWQECMRHFPHPEDWRFVGAKSAYDSL